MIKILQKEEGSLMVESIIAMSLVIIGILGIVSLLARSANITHSTTHSLQATYLASEGIEVVRNIIDTDVAENLAWGTNVKPGTYCLYYDTSNLVSCSGPGSVAYDPSAEFYTKDTCMSSYGCPFLFQRQVMITANGSAFDVSSTVSWIEGGANKSVTLEDVFQDWRQ